jgi:DNA-binding SARP family transcriptional activator
MAELTLQFLGDLQVSQDNSVCELPPSKKTRALLAYLALSSRPFRREVLCELLWEVPDDPRGSLRWSLSKIRRLVDDQQHTRIVADRSQVAFSSSATIIDVVDLHALAAEPDSLSTEQLEAAVQQYRGNFLEGLELPNFHEFYSWCIGERERAARAQATLITTLIHRLGQQPQRALDYARLLVSIDPYSEPSRVSLIQLLVQQGYNQEAEQQYLLGKRLLDDIGVLDNSALYQAWRGNTTAAEKPASAINQAPTPPQDLVGRDHELTWLNEAMQASWNTPCAQVLLLEGELGIGKSRLLAAAAELATLAGAQVLTADAFETEQIRPFALWNDALHRAALPEQSELLGGDSRVEREQLFTGLSELVTRLTRQQPLVIIFDDIQWCDESSIAALHYILRMNRDRPLTIIAAAREAEIRENGPVLQTLSGLRHDQLLQSQLIEPLPPEALAVLIANQAPEANAMRISQECGGNPLMAIALARAESEGDQGSSFNELIRGRLNRLEVDTVEALRWAAVMTPYIDLAVLEQVSGLDRYRLELAMEVGVQQGILLSGERGFQFSHELVGRSIYADISPTRQQIMHHRVAEQLEAATSLDLKLAADLARHAAQSGDAALAARAMVLAGRLCLRFYANEEAANLVRKGLQFANKLPDAERVCQTLELYDVQLSAAPLEDWEASAKTYVSLAEQALDYGALPHARLGYQMASYLRWVHGQWTEAHRESLQAERVTRGASEEEHIIGMAETAKCLALLEQDLPQADALIMEAHALARRKQFHCAAIPSALGILRYFESHYSEAEELFHDARTHWKAQGDRINEYQANEYLVMIAIEQGQFQLALDRCDSLLLIGEKLREGSEGPCARGLAALCRYGLEQEPTDLEPQFEALRLVDAKQRLAYLLNRAALVDFERGEFERAALRASEALVCAEVLARASEVLMSRVILARLSEATGDNETLHIHREAIPKLSQATGARWARKHAEPFLTTPRAGD